MNRVSQDSSSPYHHISTLLSSPAPSKAGLPDPCWGEVCSVFSSLHSRNVTVMVTSRARWPWGPLPSNARQWNENWVLMTCMRHISLAPWVLTGGGVRLSLPRAVWWQGKEWRGGGNRSRASPAKQAGGVVKAEVSASKNRTWRNKQSYCSQKWALEWGEQLNLRRL